MPMLVSPTRTMLDRPHYSASPVYNRECKRLATKRVRLMAKREVLDEASIEMPAVPREPYRRSTLVLDYTPRLSAVCWGDRHSITMEDIYL